MKKYIGKINKTVKECINEAFISQDYISNQDDLYSQAVDVMTEAVLDEYGFDEVLCDATDLQECDSDDIQNFCSLWADGNITDEDLEDGFSIKELISQQRPNSSVIEDFVEENYQDVLPDELLDAIYDRKDVSSIVNKRQYGGGGFETIRDFALDVVEKVANEAKKTAFNESLYRSRHGRVITENTDHAYEIFPDGHYEEGQVYRPAFCYADGNLEMDLGSDYFFLEAAAARELKGCRMGAYKCQYNGKPCTLYLKNDKQGLCCYDDDIESKAAILDSLWR